jgi:DNA-binding PadR family transcriptional regulator
MPLYHLDIEEVFMPKENTTIYAILGLLTHEDMSGYDIKKTIDMTISKFWDIGYGQIYPTLKTLEKDGLVTKSIKTNGKGPNRIVYSITKAGKEKLTGWLSDPAGKEYVKYEILLKIHFGNLLPVDENIKKISEFHEKNKKNLEMMNMFKENLDKVMEEDEAHYYYYLTVLFGLHTYKAYVNWAAEAIEILNKLKSK